MDYIAVLNFEQMDNGVFLTGFAKAMAKHEKRGIVLHGDSEYTNRLMQTGMMRDMAEIRAMKDLNHRLVAHFADYGISAIGVNGYQRSLITTNGQMKYHIDTDQFKRFAKQPALIISGLAQDVQEQKPVSADLSVLTANLKEQLQIEKVFVFGTDEMSELSIFDESVNKQNPAVPEENLPRAFRNLSCPVHLTNTTEFGKFPDGKSVLIT